MANKSLYESLILHLQKKISGTFERKLICKYIVEAFYVYMIRVINLDY